MENDDSKHSHPQAPKNSPPGGPETETAHETGTDKTSKQKPGKHKKKTIWRHWKSASRAKQLKWVAEGIGIITAVLILGIYIWDHIQSQRNFVAEHRPRVILSRPPQILGVVQCYVTDKAIHLSVGALRIWVKNIGQGEAVAAFVNGPEFQLVPEKKTGVQFLDTPMPITDKTCTLKISPKMKEFPVHIG
jgi:hypothetical protein